MNTSLLKRYRISPGDPSIVVVGIALQVDPTSQFHPDLVVVRCGTGGLLAYHDVIRSICGNHIVADVGVITWTGIVVIGQLGIGRITQFHVRIQTAGRCIHTHRYPVTRLGLESPKIRITPIVVVRRRIDRAQTKELCQEQSAANRILH